MPRRVLPISLAAAVAAAVVLTVGLWPETRRPGETGGGAGRVYALADVPNLLRSAKILHLHEWCWIPNAHEGPPGVQRHKMGCDTWLDPVNGRWRRWFTDLGPATGSEPTDEQKKMRYRQLQWIADGEYMLDLWCDLPIFEENPSVERYAEFIRLTPFARNLKVHGLYPQVTAFAAMLQHPETIRTFSKASQETLDGTPFDIWEHEQDEPRRDGASGQRMYDGLQKLKARIWLSPASGRVGRVEYWFKGPATNGIWVDDGGVDVVERDAIPPPGIFDTAVPPGYTLKNTKETAPLACLEEDAVRCDKIGDLELRCHIFFEFSDGVILLGWSSRDLGTAESQAPLFENLFPGGPLPELPVELRAFASDNPECDLTYTGRHLAWTQKAGKFYEWALYVPSKDLTVSQNRCAGRFKFVYQIHSAQPAAAPPPLDHPASGFCAIKDAAEFQTLVFGAMADLSDNATAPEHVTYAGVLQLIQRIRSSPAAP